RKSSRAHLGTRWACGVVSRRALNALLNHRGPACTTPSSTTAYGHALKALSGDGGSEAGDVAAAAQGLLDQAHPATDAEKSCVLGLPGGDGGLDDVEVVDLAQRRPCLAQATTTRGLVRLDVQHGEPRQHHRMATQRRVG